MLHIFFGIIVLLFMIVHWGPWGIFLGGILFYLIISQRHLADQLEALRYSIQNLQDILNANASKKTLPQVAEPAQPSEESITVAKANVITPAQPTSLAKAAEQVSPETSTTSVSEPKFTYLLKLKVYFLHGNVVAKLGIVLLFFGISFLIKYVAMHSKFPIELRLLSAAIFSLGLLIIGWRLRRTRREYGLVLQGGGIGLLYIISYSAFRFYGLLPAEFTFMFLFCLTLGAMVLALLQNAQSLIYLAALGGFLAPILTSSQSHNPLGLFAYYTVLNLMIIGIGWYKTWRPLNITGFIFTFVISSLWGYFSYQADYFWTSEIFLGLFFVLYFLLSILYTAKQPLRFTGYVDATLVFGLPLIICSLQATLVAHIRFGLAYSALTLALVYAFTATILYRLDRLRFRLLIETFLALAILLGTLVIPLTLSGHWTSVIWTLEATCIIWLGFKQQRLLPQLFGYVLLTLAQLVFLINFVNAAKPIQPFNFYCLGAVFIALADFATCRMMYKHQVKHEEAGFSIALFIAGIFWWVTAGLFEIHHFVPTALQLPIYLSLWVGSGTALVGYTSLLFFTISALISSLFAKRLSWEWLHYPALGLLFPMLLASLVLTSQSQAWLAWLLVFGAWYWILHQASELEQGLLSFLHQVGAWLLIGQLAYLIHCELSHTSIAYTWQLIAWSLCATLGLAILQAQRVYAHWPLSQFPLLYRGRISHGLVLFILAWFVFSNFASTGKAEPLPYITLINPLDITCLLGLLMVFKWFRGQAKRQVDYAPVLAGMVFFWLNMLLTRSLHHYADIPYNWLAMFSSRIAQTAFSIFWASIAFAMTFIGSRLLQRKLWFVGLIIIGMVTLKLFFIDLRLTNALLRTLSFCAVGVILLLMGYLWPLPPNPKASDKT